MKIILSTLMILAFISECKSQESNAQLIGGYDSLYQAIKLETRISKSCGSNDKVYVRFTVSKIGETDSVIVAKGICPLADSIAVGIVRRLKYIPAKGITSQFK